ncbi:hypothetical protein FVE85_9341 [Porphyridium purpureum]|uniref:Methyltransferase domain-containing protein n=1 Tax=Porphyridium purpureum TaxID=35688 RepID=A0A5J4YNR6_PORPP|nr:hypothetical protein FVE85_9341 [Porphyridium purpureum]|eukprot:POR9159..scf222_8
MSLDLPEGWRLEHVKCAPRLNCQSHEAKTECQYVRARVSKRQSRFHEVARIARDEADAEHVRIKYVCDGTTFCAKISLLVPLVQRHAVLLSPTLDVYRTLSRAQLYAPCFSFLELGCAGGVTCVRLAQYERLRLVAGLDKSAEPIEQAHTRNAKMQTPDGLSLLSPLVFAQCDVLELSDSEFLAAAQALWFDAKVRATHASLPPTAEPECASLHGSDAGDSGTCGLCRPDCVFTHVWIDLNGSRDVAVLQCVVQKVLRTLHPLLVCVKTSKWCELIDAADSPQWLVTL